MGSGRRIGRARHCSVANAKVREENGVVDADGDEDPRGVLLLTEDVRVDQDQEQGDTDEAGDVTEHLSFALPGQLQIYGIRHLLYKTTVLFGLVERRVGVRWIERVSIEGQTSGTKVEANRMVDKALSGGSVLSHSMLL